MTSLLKGTRIIYYHDLSIKIILHRTSGFSTSSSRYKEDGRKPQSAPVEEANPKSGYYPNTPAGMMERTKKPDKAPTHPVLTPYPPYPDGKNPKTGEVGGPGGPEPTRFGDWERKGRVTDF